MSQVSIHSLLPVCPCLSCLPARWYLAPKFISDGVVFSTLQRPLWLGPALSLGRVSLSNGWVQACSRKCSCNHIVAEVQRLWQIITQSWCQISPHSGTFVPIQADMAALQGLLGPLPVGRPYCLYQMHSKQWNHFSPCGTWAPQTLLPAFGDSTCFLTRALPGTELWNFRLYTPLFVGSWWY